VLNENALLWGAEMTVQVQMWCHEALFVSKQVDRAGMHMGRWFGVFSELRGSM
jgi:hypothetical protein